MSFRVLLLTTLKGYFILVDWELFSFGGVFFVYRIIFDWISLRFLFVVFLISSIVMFYRNEYMGYESLKNSFAYVVFLFVLSIIFLIIRPNLVRVILGWDGLGLVSYLLVIYYQNYKSYAAGIITCLRNRVGDRAILISMGWILSFGSLEFIYYLNRLSKEMVLVGLFIVLAAITKRAQIPFSAWLPAAMAAPTPVSALVHSSTLVTAGVYLLIRFYPLFILSEIKFLLFIIGGLTITIAGLGALYEIDLKKIIALSTLRQLGLIMISLRMGLYILAFFHLLTHALFKASLFLCAGRVIHLYSGRQDIRYLGMVTSCMPLTSSCLLICSLSLGGTPFLSAFYSKDKIIEECFSLGGYRLVCLFLLFISVLLTIIYRFRLVYYICLRNYVMNLEFNKDSVKIIKPIIVLSVGGIVGGRALRWLILDLSYDNLIVYFKSMILFMVLLGLLRGMLMHLNNIKVLRFYLGSIWFLPELSRKFFIMFNFFYGKFIFKYWDLGWNEKIGPKGFENEFNSLSYSLDKINHLSFKIVLFISVILFVFLIIFII